MLTTLTDLEIRDKAYGFFSTDAGHHFFYDYYVKYIL